MSRGDGDWEFPRRRVVDLRALLVLAAVAAIGDSVTSFDPWSTGHVVVDAVAVWVLGMAVLFRPGQPPLWARWRRRDR
jgi:hypothetical protein